MLSFLFSLAWLMVAHPFPQVLLGESVYHLKASCTGQILQVPPWLKQKSIFCSEYTVLTTIQYSEQW